MKYINQFLAICLLIVSFSACSEEEEIYLTVGEVKFNITPSTKGVQTSGWKEAKVTLYRDYTNVTEQFTLALEINEDDLTSFSTISKSVDYGNWELQGLEVYDEAGEVVLEGIGASDSRANQISANSYLPLKENVLAGELTVFALEVVSTAEEIVIPDPVDPIVPVAPSAQFIYDFEDGTDYERVDLNGWYVYNADENADKEWIYRSYEGDRYADVTAYSGSSLEYTSYLVSPALDLDAATFKNLNFETAQAYWSDLASFEVFISDGLDPRVSTLTPLSARLASNSDAEHAWVESGNIDLSSYSGVKYIVFKYAAPISGSATFRVDDFSFGFEGGATNPGDPNLTDGTKENPYDVATAMGIQDGSTAWVQGYIVGYASSGSKIITDWSSAEDTNIVIAESADETDTSNMIFVQLKDDARTALGLKTTEGASLGQSVKLEGSLTAYFGMAGLKGVSSDNFETIQ